MFLQIINYDLNMNKQDGLLKLQSKQQAFRRQWCLFYSAYRNYALATDNINTDTCIVII